MAFNPASVVRDYGDPHEEARACRTACALFDFSFLARARVSGPAGLAAIAQLTGRALGDLAPGKIRYALRENGDGHLVSDLTIWRCDDHYDLMSGRSEDIADLISAAGPEARAEDLSGAYSIFAIQGPGSLAALEPYTDVSPTAALAYFRFAQVQIDGVPCLVGRLGYTGEPGFEIIVPQPDGRRIWSRLARSARPAGFIAADALRVEAGFVLFTNEFRVAVTAREAGLERFAGARDLPTEQDIALVCFRASTREPPVLWQPTAPVARPDRGTITVTSACHSILAGGTLGLGYACKSDLLAGVPLTDPLGAFTDIEIVPRPFLDPLKRRVRAPWIKPRASS
jgi:glycine cleavage system aminomethyltransferase T